MIGNHTEKDVDIQGGLGVVPDHKIHRNLEEVEGDHGQSRQCRAAEAASQVVERGSCYCNHCNRSETHRIVDGSVVEAAGWTRHS